MWLRDASAYNVQFDGGRPILIDSLSFEVADLSAPWPAYRQFCKHFLARWRSWRIATRAAG